MGGRSSARAALVEQAVGKAGQARVVRQTAQTQLRQEQPTLAGPHPCTWPIRGHLQRTPIHSTPTRTRFRDTLLPSPTDHPPDQLQRGDRPPLLGCWRTKATLGGARAGYFLTHHQGRAPSRAVLRPAWTRSMRMLVEWHRSTRHPSSKKVLLAEAMRRGQRA